MKGASGKQRDRDRTNRRFDSKRVALRLGWLIGFVVIIAVAFFLKMGSDSSRENELKSKDRNSGATGTEVSEADTGNRIPALQMARFDLAESGGEDAVVHAAYAGSAACRECHPAAYASWAASNHGLAERAWDPALDDPAFDPSQTIVHGTQTNIVRKSGDIGEMITAGADGVEKAHRVTRAIGHKPLRQYLVEMFPGREQALEVAHDPARGDWFNIFGDEDRVPGDWGHWTGRGMNWNSMCAGCHNTRVRKNYEPTDDIYKTRMAEMGVGCEACHGPMKDHVVWQARVGKEPHESNEPKRPDPTIARHTPVQTLDTCGSCHARRNELTGDFVPGDAFADHFGLARVDETEVYHADGQVLEENYEFGSFVSSRMHAAGVVCLDCHDPHSARRLAPDNQLCLRCHSGAREGAPVILAAAHTFHKVGSTGSDCVQCHMPVTTYMQRHDRHDHSFGVPDPLLTIELGIPNACNRCHTEQDASWALEHVERWYGTKRDRGTRDRARDRARTVARVRAHDPSGVTSLKQQLLQDTLPYWQAVYTGLLGMYPPDTDTTALLHRQLKHTNAWVRAAALEALTPQIESGERVAREAAHAALKDPTRQVRMRASWLLRNELDLRTGPGRELWNWLSYHADQPGGRLQLGGLLLDKGVSDQALSHFQKAVDWDPNSPVIRHEHAIALSLTGRHDAARRELERAVEKAPHEAEYRYKLALAWNELGDLSRAAMALREAVRLDPGHARALYNLGLAQSAMNEPEAAVETLRRAEASDRLDPRAPHARATIHARMGEMDEAMGAAREALAREPSYGPARELLSQLEQFGLPR